MRDCLVLPVRGSECTALSFLSLEKWFVQIRETQLVTKDSLSHVACHRGVRLAQALSYANPNQRPGQRGQKRSPRAGPAAGGKEKDKLTS